MLAPSLKPTSAVSSVTMAASSTTPLLATTSLLMVLHSAYLAHTLLLKMVIPNASFAPLTTSYALFSSRLACLLFTGSKLSTPPHISDKNCIMYCGKWFMQLSVSGKHLFVAFDNIIGSNQTL